MSGDGGTGAGGPTNGGPTDLRPRALRPRNLSPRALLALALLVLAVLAAALAGPWSPQVGEVSDLPAFPPPVEQTETAEPEDPVDGSGDEVPSLPALDPRPLIWVAVAGLLALAAWLVRTVLGRRESGSDAPDGLWDDVPEEPGPSLTVLRLGLEEAAEDLRREGEPADAVVAAWVALERAAGRSGVPRDPASTPTEFVLAVLDRTSADRRATRSLLAGYERARFSDLPVTEADVAQAATDLRVLAATLRAGASR